MEWTARYKKLLYVGDRAHREPEAEGRRQKTKAKDEW